MSMIPSGADASVSIKVDVDDAGAQARLAALEARMKALEKQSEKSGKAANSYGQQLDDMSKKTSKTDRSKKDLLKTEDALEKMFGRLGKLVKFAGIEFAALTAGIGAMRLALWAGQTAMKGFHALLRATGAAAGVAVGAIATVLAALREVQAVKLAPILGGIAEGKTQTNAFFADRRFAMFDQKTMARIMQSAAEQGRAIDASFRNELARLANYSLGDPKKLAEIQKAFQQMSKDGKVTAKTYEDLKAASPALAKAFDEMVGGQKKGEAAAKAGSVSYQKFFDAVMAGNLEALKPFQGALDNINDTLVGRFKGALVGVKEQLTRMGEPLLKGFKRPITILEREISLFVLKINGTVGKVFPTLFGVKNENNNIITRMFDKLASSINTNMGKISGWIEGLRRWGRSVREFFSGTGDVLRKFSTGWDKLYNKILKPIGIEVVRTIGHLFDQFNKTIDDAPLNSFQQAIENIGEIVRNLITGFAQLKKVMAPVLTAFLNMASAISRLTSIPGFSMLLPMLLMGKMMGGGKGGKGGAGGGGAGMLATSMFMAGGMGPAGGIANMLTMPLMMGLSGFGMNTKYGAASAANYAANRARGSGRIPSLLFSGGLGFGFASNRAAGMGRGASALFSGSASRSAIANGFTDRRGVYVPGTVAATQQARIDALMKNRDQMGSILGQGPTGMGIKAYMRNLGYDFVAGDPNAPKGSSYKNDRYVHRTDPGAEELTLAQAKALRSQEMRNTVAARRKQNIQAIRQGKLEAIETGKIQGKVAGKAFVKDSAAKFGRAAGMMAATVGATMLGGYIQQRAGTNKTMAGLGGALSGAGMGASMGAAFGPYGMLIGGLGGAALGLFSGMRNAERLRDQNTKTSIAAVRSQISGERTFNRQSDFTAALDAAATVRRELTQVSEVSAGGLQQQIDALKAQKQDWDTASMIRGQLPAALQGFIDFAGTKGVTAVYDNIIQTAKDGSTFYADVFSGYFQDSVGHQFDAEDNRVEDIAREYASKTLGYSAEAVNEAFNGKDWQDAIGGLEYLANLRVTGDIGLMEEQLKALEEKYPDVGAATEEYYKELERISDSQKAFANTSARAMLVLEGTGVTMDQVSSLFDEMGLSLSETSVGINEFNKLIGMTGDIAADSANAAGRLARSLLTQTQRDMDLADARSRLQQQLETLFATKGSISSDEGIRIAGETLNEVIGNATAAMAAGTVKYEDLIGAAGTPGMLQNQLYELVLGAAGQGVSQPVVDQLIKLVLGENGMLAQIEAGKTDPFARLQYDAQFNQGFTNKMNDLTTRISTSVTPNMTQEQVDELITGSQDELVKWLDDNGIKVDEQTKGKLDTMLRSSFLNSATAISNAMYNGGNYAADAIRRALTGAPPPSTPNPAADTARSDPSANPYGGTGNPLIDKPFGGDKTGSADTLEKKVGDTRTSRFGRVMAAHNRLNSMVPGRRTVTSGIRDTMLGSIGSDHSTGSAYDLVGDNLVSYANNVRNIGGFAEFHGGGSGKHLHVVPPVGDTTTPKGGGYGGSSSTNYYNFEINGGPGMDPDDIADAVMQRIARAERNRRERS